MPDKKLMTPKEVADLLGVKLSTIYQLAFYRRIPAIHLSNKMLRFDPDQIKEWLASKTSPVSPRPRVSISKGTGRPRGRLKKNDAIDHLVEAAKREVLT